MTNCIYIIDENDFVYQNSRKKVMCVCKKCGNKFYLRKDMALPVKKCIHDIVSGHERLKSIFYQMKNRCYNQKDKNYKNYGGKGIRICDEWLKSKSNFIEWAISNGYKDNLTIDRINPNKNYCPENCRWIPREMNSRFKSTTNKIEINGFVKSGIQWSMFLGYSRNYINKKIKKIGIENTKEFIISKL